jgi:hypothetical protein
VKYAGYHEPLILLPVVKRCLWLPNVARVCDLGMEKSSTCQFKFLLITESQYASEVAYYILH